jgi:hypothetical protein
MRALSITVHPAGVVVGVSSRSEKGGARELIPGALQATLFTPNAKFSVRFAVRGPTVRLAALAGTRHLH